MTQAPTTAQAVLPVFHITHWKGGSEWVRSVLNALAPERFVPRKQVHAHLHEQPIRADGVYSPVYMPRGEFERIITVPTRRFIVIRDLRDTLVSWYFSARYSHPTQVNPNLADKRNELEQMSREDGLLHMLEHKLPFAARIQTSWRRHAHGATPEYIVRYEDLWADQNRGFADICEHIGLDVSPARLAQVVAAMSFESRSGGRKPGEEDVRSHFRKGEPGDWRTHFTPRITEAFKERFGHTLIDAGYETSLDWDASPST